MQLVLTDSTADDFAIGIKHEDLAEHQSVENAGMIVVLESTPDE